MELSTQTIAYGIQAVCLVVIVFLLYRQSKNWKQLADKGAPAQPSPPDVTPPFKFAQILATQFPVFNAMHRGGIRTGTLTGITGCPASGKTNFAIQLAKGFAAQGYSGIFVCGDDAAIHIAERYGVSKPHIYCGKVNIVNRVGKLDQSFIVDLIKNFASVYNQSPDFIVFDDFRVEVDEEYVSERAPLRAIQAALQEYSIAGIVVFPIRRTSSRLANESPLLLSMMSISVGVSTAGTDLVIESMKNRYRENTLGEKIWIDASPGQQPKYDTSES